MDWNRAVALARALDGNLPAAEADSPQPPTLAELEDEHVRARSVHQEALETLVAALEGPLDAADLQRRYATLQRTQLTSSGRLRGHLRDLLSRRDDPGARLAEIDAVMEQALAPREYRLLNSLTTRVGEHALGLLAPATDSFAADATPPSMTAWPPAFRDAVRELLQAELDLRFHPIEGLFAALRLH